MTRRAITVRQLEILDAVAREGSVTAAANALHLTQPAVSMQLRQLEDQLEIALFEPVGRGLQITEPGRELAALGGDLLRRVDEFVNAARDLRGVRRGRVRLGVVGTAIYFAPRLLAQFMKSHPGLDIKLNIYNRENMLEQLQSYNIDLGIMGRPPEGTSLVGTPFAPNPLAIVVSPSHPLSLRRELTPEDLEHEPFIVREPGSGTRIAMDRYFAEAGVQVNAIMETDSNETIKQAVMAGIGIGFLSLHTVRLEQAAGRIVPLNVAGLPLRRQWFVVHTRQRNLTPAAAEFREYLLREADDLMRAAL
ncbi:transcriptional regulator, LysR family protein [Burkholderiales bacterium GJ-E10]|nr:transcriptional regulator, LysR family protein [Burkholderiales bacterium GJ-E10]